MKDWISDILSEQIVNIAGIVVEYNENVANGKINSNEKFTNRVNSVMGYVTKLRNDYVSENLIVFEMMLKLNELKIKLIEYKDSYKNKNGYGYKAMNSLFDIVDETYNNII